MSETCQEKVIMGTSSEEAERVHRDFQRLKEDVEAGAWPHPAFVASILQRLDYLPRVQADYIRLSMRRLLARQGRAA